MRCSVVLARSAAAFVLFLCAACDAAGTGVDAGADAGADLGTAGPLAPEPPELGPCPSGWRAVADPSGATTCDPWPESGHRDDCAYDEAHLPGTPGCARIGTACAADGWPSDLPSGAPILYVDDDAAPGGDGASRATALQHVVDATGRALPGTVIAIATGRYDERINLVNGATLWGACVDGTRLTSSVAVELAAVVHVTAPDETVRNLSIDSPSRQGVWIQADRTTLIDVVVDGAIAAGIVATAGTVDASDLVVRGTRTLSTDGMQGYGVEATGTSQVTIRGGALEANHEAGIAIFMPGTSVTASDVAIRGTLPVANGTFGIGAVANSASLVLSRAAVEGNAAAGIGAAGYAMTGERATVAATDVVVRDTRGDAHGQAGIGIEIHELTSVTLSRLWISGSHLLGLDAGGTGTTVDASDVVITDTLAEVSSRAYGRAVDIARGATARIDRGVFARSRDVGVAVVAAALDATSVVVRDTMPKESDGTYGAGIWAQDSATVTLSRVAVVGASVVGVASVRMSQVTATDLEIRDVASAPCGASCGGQVGGFGLSAHFGASLSVASFLVANSAVCGVVVGEDGPPATAMDLARGAITVAPVGACVQVDGYDASRLRNDVQYREVGVPLQATSYALPGDVGAP